MPPDPLNPHSAQKPNALRAAQYVRMSTEHQQYSTNNQSDKILEYAQCRNIEIVRTYADEGNSGLSLGGRASLQKLIADVETGGMKAHIGVDAESGLVHSVIGTAANVHDVTQASALLHGEERMAFGDAGYQGVE